MGDKELQKLIKESEGADLGTLLAAKEAARRAVITDPTPANLLALDRASKMLAAATIAKEPLFQNRMEVLRHLQGRGLKIHRSKLYKDCKKGLLKIESDGTILESAVESYIKHPLSKLSSSEDDHLEELQRDRLIAETQRAMAQAEHWTLKTKIARGLYVEYVQYEQDLAARITILKSDMENFARSSSGEIIQCVEGNSAKTVDLIEFLLVKFRSWLARYAEKKDFIIPNSKIGNNEMEKEEE